MTGICWLHVSTLNSFQKCRKWEAAIEEDLQGFWSDQLFFCRYVHRVLVSAKRRCGIVTWYQIFEHLLPGNGFIVKKVMIVIVYTETLCHFKKKTYFHRFYVNEYFGILNNVCLREWINEYVAHLCSLLSECQDKRHIIASGLECSISTFMWKCDNTLFLFAILCCIASTYFHSFCLTSRYEISECVLI